MVVFKHPNGTSARLDRYAWFLSHAPQSHDVTTRLDTGNVLERLTDRDVARLFRRSMAIEARRTMVNLAVGKAG
jgi:hypothetical protein